MLHQLQLRNISVVQLPIGNYQGGIFAWTALAHEVSEHDLLSTAELINQIKDNVLSALRSRGLFEDHTVNYWTRTVTDEKGRLVGSRIEEISSDVAGILNLGPAAAIGLIGYLKGSSSNNYKLQSIGYHEDPHAADILRGVVAVEVVRQLRLDNAGRWAEQIEQIVLEDWPKSRSLSPDCGHVYKPIALDNNAVDFNTACKSAKAVANAILNAPLLKLGGKSLRQIRVWDMQDQTITEEIGASLSTPQLQGIPSCCQVNDQSKIEDKHAKHIVAAATIESLKANADSETIFQNMITLLEKL